MYSLSSYPIRYLFLYLQLSYPVHKSYYLVDHWSTSTNVTVVDESRCNTLLKFH